MVQKRDGQDRGVYVIADGRRDLRSLLAQRLPGA
jgi:hypothetical protein